MVQCTSILNFLHKFNLSQKCGKVCCMHKRDCLPTDVSKSIEAMFSSAGRKKGFSESIAASVSKVFENTVPEKVITLPPSSREGADNDSSREGAGNESSGSRAMAIWRPVARKWVLPVASPFSQIPYGADVERFSQIPCGADVESLA